MGREARASAGRPAAAQLADPCKRGKVPGPARAAAVAPPGPLATRQFLELRPLRRQPRGGRFYVQVDLVAVPAELPCDDDRHGLADGVLDLADVHRGWA